MTGFRATAIMLADGHARLGGGHGVHGNGQPVDDGSGVIPSIVMSSRRQQC